LIAAATLSEQAVERINMKQSVHRNIWSTMPPRLKLLLVNLCMSCAVAGFLACLAVVEAVRLT
jgi:hypothetical protein